MSGQSEMEGCDDTVFKHLPAQWESGCFIESKACSIASYTKDNAPDDVSLPIISFS